MTEEKVPDQEPTTEEPELTEADDADDDDVEQPADAPIPEESQ